MTRSEINRGLLSANDSARSACHPSPRTTPLFLQSGGPHVISRIVMPNLSRPATTRIASAACSSR